MTASLRSAERQRSHLLHQVSAMLDRPMTVLAFVWLAILVIDLTQGLTPSLSYLNYALWVLFIAHFVLEFAIAPSKGAYLRRNWITAIALLLPALRVLRVFRAFRFLRAARAARSTGLVRLLTSLNRGMRAARRVARRHAVGYVALLTLLVTFAGAAGMYAFERPAAIRDAGYPEEVAAHGLVSYGESVWWTAMTMTTMGSEKWPKTPEGRVLALLLAVYAFAIFGYITATIASYFVGREPAVDVAALQKAVEALQVEVRALRSQTAGPL